MNTILTFDNKDEALAYRRAHGTGGWIFAATDDLSPRAMLFPHPVPAGHPAPTTNPATLPTPSGVMSHPITQGRSGVLC